jgi:ABC-type transport system involved in multi-copper enzyme maturation permease subunit
MVKLVFLEYFKNNKIKNFILPLIVINFSFFITLMMLIFIPEIAVETHYNIEGNFKRFVFNALQMSLYLFSPLMLVIMTTSNLGKEFNEKTFRNILTTGVCRTRILISKFLYLSLIVLICFIFNFVMTIIISLFNNFEFNLNDLINVIQTYMISYLFIIYLIPLIMFFTMIIKNNATIIVISFITLLGGTLLKTVKPNIILPFSFSMDALNLLTEDMPISNLTLIMCLLYFISFSIASYYYFKKQDLT